MSLALRTSLLVFLAAVLLFVPFLGAVHLFDWDEINFAECAREMVLLGDYTRMYINFEPFWEKPPLFIWMQALSIKAFGVNEFAARFPNAVAGMITLVVIYNIGKRLVNHKFGVFWVLAYAGSFFPNMYFKSGIIDPFFNLFIFLSLYHFILYFWKREGMAYTFLKRNKGYYAAVAGVFMGLAIMTKGPVALLIFGLCVTAYWVVYRKFRVFWGWGHVLLFLFTLFLVTLAWYGYETVKNGPWFLKEFLVYQVRLFTTHDAGQKGFFGYHYVVILIGCFPASVLAIASFFRSRNSPVMEQDFKRWMLILFWVVTILFSLVQSRIIHYSSMAWFPVTFLAAYTMYNLHRQTYEWARYTQVLLLLVGSLLAIALVVFPYVANHAYLLEPYLKDDFARASLNAEVNWNGFEPLIGIVFMGILLLGLRAIKRNNAQRATWIWFGGTAVTVFLASALIVPRVERFSQGAAIDFLKERVGENCYVDVVGYKSYAHLFYAQKPKPTNPQSADINWLITGDIDKPVYFITKVHKADYYLKFDGIYEVGRKNGFVFLKRDKKK